MFTTNSLVVLVVALVPLALGQLQQYNSAGGFDCSNLDDGNYPEPSGNPPSCNTFYWSCSGHGATRIDCQAGLFFDPERNWCESKDNVVICGGKRATTISSVGADSAYLAPSDFDCSDKDDGFYANPKDSCSKIYFSCSGGIARPLECQEGLIYDPETMVCDKPESTFTCTGTRATTLITEAPATYAAPQTYAMDCVGKDDGSHPHPTEPCSQSFFVCSNGHISMVNCSGKTFYDATTERCETWRNVFACSGLAPEVPDTPITTLAPQTYQHPDMDCTNMVDGPYQDPLNQCSNRYFECSNGITHERKCHPSSLVWNIDGMICDSYDNTFACTGKRKVTTVATLAPTSPPRIAEFPCKADGFYADPMNACSSLYWVCSKGTDSKMFCAEGLKFDIEQGMCDYWDNVFACSGQRPQPTYAPAPTTNDFRDVPMLPVDCRNAADGDYRDPAADCSQKYYSCSGNVATERFCGDGLLFDPELLRCEKHEDIPACTGNARVLTAPTQAPLPIEEYPFDCTYLKDADYPAGDCQGYFWSCVGGKTYPRPCQEGLAFDDEENACDSPANVRSCGGLRTIAPMPPQTYNRVPVYPVDCSKLADGFYSDPADKCSMTYYVCSNGRTNELQCAAALKFDITIKRCELKVHVPACGGQPRSDTYQPAPQDYNSITNLPPRQLTRGSRPSDNNSYGADRVVLKHRNSYQRLRSSAPLLPRDQNSYNPNS